MELIVHDSSDSLYQKLIQDAPIGCSCQRIIFNAAGKPVDLELIEVNRAFEEITGFKASDLVGRKASDMLPGDAAALLPQAGQVEDLWVSPSGRTWEYYSPTAGKHFRVRAFSPEKEFVAAFITDITLEKQNTLDKEAILSVLRDAIFELDDHFVFRHVYTSDDSHLFVPRERIIGSAVQDLFPAKLSSLLIPAFLHARDSGLTGEVVYPSPLPGDERWFKAIMHYLRAGSLSRYVVSVVDITESQKAAESARQHLEEQQRAVESLRQSEEKYRLVAEYTADTIWVLNTRMMRFTYFSPSVTKLLGCSPEEALTLSLQDLFTPDSLTEFNRAVAEGIRQFLEKPGTPIHQICETQQYRRDGRMIWVEMSVSYRLNLQDEIEIIGVSRNIDERKKAEALRHLSFHDQLTETYNRHFFDTIIEEEMDRSDRYDEPLSLLLLDIDHFKQVNDTWGHPVGDEILKQIARVVGSSIRSSDILVRFGGEEFAILMPQTGRDGAAAAAEKIRENIQKNVHPVAGVTTASFGAAERLKSESFKHWYRRVDGALYRAKQGGRNRVAVSSGDESFPSSMVRIGWRSEWESGNAQIDGEHQELIEIANGLFEVSLANRQHQEVLAHLDRLLDHIAHHFRSEEMILRAVGYPDYRQHANIHKSLVSKATRLRESYLRGDLKTTAFFSFVVDDVLIGHMQNTDSKFFPYLQAAAGTAQSAQT